MFCVGALRANDDRRGNLGRGPREIPTKSEIVKVSRLRLGRRGPPGRSEIRSSPLGRQITGK
jgi:hypothetical protein